MKLPTKLPSKSVVQTDTPTESVPKKRFKKPKHLKRVVSLVLVVAIVGGVAFHFLAPKDTQTAQTYSDETVARRDIQTSLTATGTLAPLSQYNVTTLARGEVLTCTFEEGQVVQKGDLLYTIDSSEVQDSIDRSRLSLEQSQLSYQQQLETLADLTVKASKSGVVTSVDVEVGDSVQQGATIATVRDSATMVLKVPFNSADAASFFVGQSASVTLDGSFETLTGSVTAIDATDTVLTGNQLVRNVTIAVSNPGALSPNAAATATIGGVACNSAANFSYNAEFNITADTAGKVASLSIAEGGRVTSGMVVAKLTSTSLQNQIKNSELSLQSAQLSLDSTIASLDDYNITAPISGTVITKNTQVGDSIDSSSGVSALAVIYDMSALTFDIALDELDVNQVAVGQKVEVTVDALDGESFDGSITNISVAGTTSNGATTYPVTVQIDNPPSTLLPGMNVNASIITGESTGVIAVPTAAVQRGDLVFVKDSTTSSSTSKTDTASDSTTTDKGNRGDMPTGDMPTGDAPTGDMPTGDMPTGDMPTGDMPTGDAPTGNASSGTTNTTASSTPTKGTSSNVPEGYHAVQVVTGLSDDNYIEIVSGLSEGDIVYVPQVVRSNSSSTTITGMMPAGGMTGGMTGGGNMSFSGGGSPPSGGMSGGGGMP